MALAIFDLDETLIHGDCASLWSEQMARLGWVDGKEFLRRDHELMDAYGKGHLQMEDYMANVPSEYELYDQLVHQLNDR